MVRKIKDEIFCLKIYLSNVKDKYRLGMKSKNYLYILLFEMIFICSKQK